MIRLHIEHLVVDGIELGASNGIDLQTAMQARLAEVLADRYGALGEFGATSRQIDALSPAPLQMQMTGRPDAQTFGLQVADTLAAGLPGAGGGRE
jgi:hypothetical protein